MSAVTEWSILRSLLIAEYDRLADEETKPAVGLWHGGMRHGIRSALAYMDGIEQGAELRGDRKAEVGRAARPAVCDHEPTPDIAEAVARLAAGGQYNSARKLLHDNSRLTWEEAVARVDGLSGKAGAR